MQHAGFAFFTNRGQKSLCKLQAVLSRVMTVLVMYQQVGESSLSLAASSLQSEEEEEEEVSSLLPPPGGAVAGRATVRCFPCLAASRDRP